MRCLICIIIMVAPSLMSLVVRTALAKQEDRGSIPALYNFFSFLGVWVKRKKREPDVIKLLRSLHSDRNIINLSCVAYGKTGLNKHCLEDNTWQPQKHSFMRAFN